MLLSFLFNNVRCGKQGGENMAGRADADLPAWTERWWEKGREDSCFCCFHYSAICGLSSTTILWQLVSFFSIYVPSTFFPDKTVLYNVCHLLGVHELE